MLFQSDFVISKALFVVVAFSLGNVAADVALVSHAGLAGSAFFMLEKRKKGTV